MHDRRIGRRRLPGPADERRTPPAGKSRLLTFIATGARLSAISLAVSSAGRGASSEALAFLAGIDAHFRLCRRVQSLLRGAQGIFLEMAGPARPVREGAAAPSRYSGDQVLHGKGVGHVRRSVEIPEAGRVSPRPAALSAPGGNLLRALQPQGLDATCAAAWAPAHGGGDSGPKRKARTSISSPAFSIPTPSSSSRLGASSSTSRPMNRSSSAISSFRSRTLRAGYFSESLVATTGSRYPTVSGLQAAQVRRRCMRVRLRTWSRTSLGCSDDRVVKLLQGRTTALHRRLSGRAQHP